MVVPIQDMRRDVIQAIKFGLTMSDEVVAVHVTDDLDAGERLRERFERQVPGVELVIVESPYRELVQPLIRYLEVTADRDPSTVTIVLIPERIIEHWWERFLYNQNVYRMRDALTGPPGDPRGRRAVPPNVLIEGRVAEPAPAGQRPARAGIWTARG